MTDFTKKAWKNGIELTLIVGFTGYMMARGVFNFYVIAIALIASISPAIFLRQFCYFKRNETIRVMPKILKKIGFAVEETEWSDDKNTIRIIGKYNDEIFSISCERGSHYTHIIDFPWHKVSVNDPDMQKYVEAANFVNSQTPNTSVVISEPDEHGERSIATVCATILPGATKKTYIEHLLNDILSRKRDFIEALQKDMPWLNAPKSAIIVTPKPQEN